MSVVKRVRSGEWRVVHDQNQEDRKNTRICCTMKKLHQANALAINCRSSDGFNLPPIPPRLFLIALSSHT